MRAALASSPLCALQIPVQLCFFAEARHLLWLTYMNDACDAVYWTQMLLRLVTTYVNDKSVVIDTPALIRKNYLQTDFLLDALSCWPMNYIAIGFGAPQIHSAALRLFRLISVRYGVATYREWERTRADVSLSTGIVQHLLIYLLVVHMCSCAWNTLGYRPDSTVPIERHWAWKYARSIDAVGGTPYRLGVLQGSWEFRLLMKYVEAAFFNMATMMTFSTGSLPMDFEEVAFCIFVMILNVTLYAWAVSQISALVMKQDDEIVMKRGQLELVYSYLNYIRVPKDLENEIASLFKQRLKDASLSAVRPEEIHARLPVSLQIEVSRVTLRSRITVCSLFTDCSEGFIDRLASLVSVRVVEPETTLFRTSEACKELYIIESGAVILYDDPQEEGGEPVVTNTLLNGEPVGEVAFVFGLRHVSSARSESDGETKLLVLLSEDFKLLMKMFPDQEDKLMDNAMSQYDGMMYSAPAASGQTRHHPINRA